jgi:Uma2 family endonuclease
MTVTPRERYRLSAAEYDRMIEAGLLADARVELIDGELLAMNAQGAPHSMLTVWLRRLLEQTYGPGFYVQDHSPLATGAYDQPEPDLALVRGAPEKTAARHPSGRDVVLVIEVAFTTLREDRAKADVYARGHVPEYWLINPAGPAVEVHRAPQPDGTYGEKRVYHPRERITWPERQDAIDATELLP